MDKDNYKSFVWLTISLLCFLYVLSIINRYNISKVEKELNQIKIEIINLKENQNE